MKTSKIVLARLPKALLPAILCAAGGCGWQRPPPPVPPPVAYVPAEMPRYSPADDPQPHYTILVESMPAGAAVEFNDAFMGTTPCRIRVPGKEGRQFEHRGISPHVLKALPSRAGGYVQRKTFDGGSDIPERVFFDMRLVYR